MNGWDAAASGVRRCPLCGWELARADGHAEVDVYAVAKAWRGHDARWHGGALSWWLRAWEQGR